MKLSIDLPPSYRLSDEQVMDIITFVAKFLPYNIKRLKRLDIKNSPLLNGTWKGWSEYPPRSTIEIELSGKKFSQTYKYNTWIRTFTHREVLVVALAHEMTHQVEGRPDISNAHTAFPRMTSKKVLRKYRQHRFWRRITGRR